MECELLFLFAKSNMLKPAGSPQSTQTAALEIFRAENWSLLRLLKTSMFARNLVFAN